MTNLTTLPALKTRSAKRLGRGHGSGKVKTAGRGTKGQKARENVKLTFAGSSLQASWLKRLPLIRGKGKNKSHNDHRPFIVNVKYLNSLKPNTEVTLKSLQAAKIIDTNIDKVKILGDGDLKVALVVKLPCSKGAVRKIEKAGGKIA
ncbi:50S ribosomal protein L15 [Patescibacteria group bacterium]|nr:50S ribosomal protein L15 [Patescibacteria group bacterium]